MGKPDQVSSLFWSILGLGVVYLSYRLGLGELTHPGPGFLTFWSGVILCCLSAVVFFQGVRAQRGGTGVTLPQRWAGMAWPKSVYVIIALLAYVLTFTYLGFLLSTIVLLIFLFKGIEPETWRRAFLSAGLSSFISYILFGIWLQVQLPRGLLEKLLF